VTLHITELNMNALLVIGSIRLLSRASTNAPPTAQLRCSYKKDQFRGD